MNRSYAAVVSTPLAEEALMRKLLLFGLLALASPSVLAAPKKPASKEQKADAARLAQHHLEMYELTLTLYYLRVDQDKNLEEAVKNKREFMKFCQMTKRDELTCTEMAERAEEKAKRRARF